MIVKVLGTCAATGSPTPATCYLIDDNTLLDCGDSVQQLPVENRLAIERVLLTHAHADHSDGLPSLLQAHAEHGGRGVTVYTQQETIDELLHGQLEASPDYVAMKTADGSTLLRLVAIEVGDAIPLPDGMATALPAQHSIPAVGWLIEGPWRALTYTGDTALCPAFWHWSANVPSLSDIICVVGCASDAPDIAASEGHMTPESLVTMLDLVPPNVQIWIADQQSGASHASTLSEVRRLAPSVINIADISADSLIDL